MTCTAVASRISIHAPLAGRDDVHRDTAYNGPKHFNPRAPCGARLQETRGNGTPIDNFNPRAPCGARQPICQQKREQDDFNPRAPCGARRFRRTQAAVSRLFQSTRPLRGATSLIVTVCVTLASFQSTRPLRGATMDKPMGEIKNWISIHAPLAGRDTFRQSCNARQ